MKRIVFVLLLFLFAGCDFRAREEALRLKDSVLQKKEADLVTRERLLTEAESKLKKTKQKIDSVAKTDSSSFYNPALNGSWSTQMSCTETTCNEYAVGDTKTERWEFYYDRYTLRARAFTKNTLVRTYSGIYRDNTIELTGVNVAAQEPITMRVRLQMADSANISGQRELVRENNCKVIYSLQLKRL